jgi:hypothetical protein
VHELSDFIFRLERRVVALKLSASLQKSAMQNLVWLESEWEALRNLRAQTIPILTGRSINSVTELKRPLLSRTGGEQTPRALSASKRDLAVCSAANVWQSDMTVYRTY